MMKLNIPIIISVFILFSCNSKQHDFIGQESVILKEKIDYNKSHIEMRVLQNPMKAFPYLYLSRDLSSLLDTLRENIDNRKTILVNNGLDNLKLFVSRSYLLDSDYLKQIVVPNRIDKWICIYSHNKCELEHLDLLKFDLLKFESEINEYLYTSIEKDYYRFNKLVPIVIDSSQNIKVGETYNSNILLAAIDTTQDPIVKITEISTPDSILLRNSINDENVNLIPIENGFGVFQMTVRKPGLKKYKGVIQIRNPNGEVDSFLFEKTFNVHQ